MKDWTSTGRETDVLQHNFSLFSYVVWWYPLRSPLDAYIMLLRQVKTWILISPPPTVF